MSEFDPRTIIYTPAEIGALGTEYLEYRRANKDSGIPLYIPSVDKDLIPLLPGELVTVIGRPGNGKTGFMMRWARERARWLARNGKADRIVLYATYEQHIEDLHAFHVAAEKRMSITDMSRGNLKDSEFEQARLAGAARVNLPLWFIGHSMKRRKKRPVISVTNLALALAELEAWSEEKYTIDVVFIDYLQRIPFDGQVEGKAIATSEILDRLKDGALAFGAPFVVGVQARREVDQRQIPIPGLDDGQWTSNIEQASDKVFSLVRPSRYRKDGELFGDNVLVQGHTQMLVSLLKQKLGIDNRAYWIMFDPIYNRLDEAEEKNVKL
jgi:replicative DNA helicase